jgi:hypothetical protein
MPWLDIAFRYHLTPDIFFVPLEREPVGPPYGRAYGYYRKYGPTKEWRNIALTDDDVVALVNLRFMSERYGMAPESVMAMHSQERSFVAINDRLHREKGHAQKAKQEGKGKPKKK